MLTLQLTLRHLLIIIKFIRLIKKITFVLPERNTENKYTCL